MNQTELAPYTQVNDGQYIWYANTKELVTALVSIGYTADAFQGYLALAEPKRNPIEYHEFEDNADAYSDLCSRVESIEADLIPSGTDLETFTYDPATVGGHRMRCSGALYQAVWNATS